MTENQIPGEIRPLEGKAPPSHEDHLLPSVLPEEEDRRRYWLEAHKSLTGSSLSMHVNIGYECTDRQVLRLQGSKTAILWVGAEGETEHLSYSELTTKSNSFAHVLSQLGLQRGEAVFSLLGRIPELYMACLGTLKYEAVFCPLFAAFGPEPIKTRMNLGRARVLITTGRIYEKKFGALSGSIQEHIPTLEHIILVRPEGLSHETRSQATFLRDETGTRDTRLRPLLHDFGSLMLDAPTLMDSPTTAAETPALIHFTSGTTGTPKGAVHAHQSVVCHHDTARTALGLTENDIYWCTADPGWVTGTSYGIFAPLTIGATMVVTEREFDPDMWYQTLETHHVSVWYTAPTALRMLMKAGDDKARTYNLAALRHIASVGEPLNAEVVHWGRNVLGKDIHDTWWQTETGCIMIANPPARKARPGAMGITLPGMAATVVDSASAHDATKSLLFVTDPTQEGELALHVPWPSLFRTYLGNEARYKATLRGDWYLTGDLVRRDAEGYFWFVGRLDDVIKSSGHLVGPFEIESVLLEHPGIAEAGVIGKPHETLGEVVKAFLSLKEGFSPSEALQRSVLAHARERLGAAVAPREISFMNSLPKTRSGKVMRRLLKARELGLPEGDTSTLESM